MKAVMEYTGTTISFPVGAVEARVDEGQTVLNQGGRGEWWYTSLRKLWIFKAESQCLKTKCNLQYLI